MLNKLQLIRLNTLKKLSQKIVVKEYSLVSYGVFMLILFGSILFLSILFLNTQLKLADTKTLEFKNKLSKISSQLFVLQNEDQVKKNRNLESEINNIHDNYKSLVSSYENLLDLKTKVKDTTDIDNLFAESLSYLSDRNYSSASADIKLINSLIQQQNDKIVATFTIPANVVSSNTPPGAGFSVQTVQTDDGSFLVDIVAADLNSTRVIVDTASDSDCSNNCPVMSLGDYAARNGAFAGINGSYFCPADYPSCSGKTNSYDLLIMNKNKHYFNSDNNVYSTNPAVIFSGNSARFVGQALEWGRDTSVDSVLSNYPLLVSGGQVAYSGGGDPKFAPKGPRDFIGVKGSTVYIGMISNASMGDAAKVLKALGLENALNLDEGGSTALWYGGYKAGPGRNIPNAILFVHK